MDFLYDIPPFNMASGPEFLVFYFVVSLSGLFFAVVVQGAIGELFDRRVAANAATTAASAAHGSPYRADLGRSAARSRLTRGALPQPDEHYAIAYLKAGTRGVANTLISLTLAAGWLVVEPEEDYGVGIVVRSPPSDPTQVMLYKRLLAIGALKIAVSQLRNAATVVAELVEAEVIRDLEDVGLLRRKQTVRRLQAIVWVVGAVLLGVGAVRMARGISLNRPVTLLLVEMFGVALASALFAALSAKNSSLKSGYLAWLSDATVSVRSDVHAGQRRDPASVGLAVALAGEAPLAVPGLEMLATLLIPAAVIPAIVNSGGASSGSDCSTSSCSSSSCSSGGSSCGG